MDYFQPDAQFYWDAFVPPSQRAVSNVAPSFSVTTSTTTIVEYHDGDECYISTPPFRSSPNQSQSTARGTSSNTTSRPTAGIRRSRRASYGQYNQLFIEAERRDLELTRQRYRSTYQHRENSAEKLYRKANNVLDKAIKQPWKKIMEKVRRKPQPNAGNDAENDVQKDIGRTSDVHIKYVDGLRLRGSKRRV